MNAIKRAENNRWVKRSRLCGVGVDKLRKSVRSVPVRREVARRRARARESVHSIDSEERECRGVSDVGSIKYCWVHCPNLRAHF